VYELICMAAVRIEHWLSDEWLRGYRGYAARMARSGAAGA
jgi:hypothetical protein